MVSFIFAQLATRSCCSVLVQHKSLTKHTTLVLPFPFSFSSLNRSRKIASTTVRSSKTCITGDAIPEDNPLAILHANESFAAVVARIVGEQRLFPTGDELGGGGSTPPLLHYYPRPPVVAYVLVSSTVDFFVKHFFCF